MIWAKLNHANFQEAKWRLSAVAEKAYKKKHGLCLWEKQSQFIFAGLPVACL
jgi:hypothetical protein